MLTKQYEESKKDLSEGIKGVEKAVKILRQEKKMAHAKYENLWERNKSLLKGEKPEKYLYLADETPEKLQLSLSDLEHAVRIFAQEEGVRADLAALQTKDRSVPKYWRLYSDSAAEERAEKIVEKDELIKEIEAYKQKYGDIKQVKALIKKHTLELKIIETINISTLVMELSDVKEKIDTIQQQITGKEGEKETLVEQLADLKRTAKEEAVQLKQQMAENDEKIAQIFETIKNDHNYTTIERRILRNLILAIHSISNASIKASYEISGGFIDKASSILDDVKGGLRMVNVAKNAIEYLKKEDDIQLISEIFNGINVEQMVLQMLDSNTLDLLLSSPYLWQTLAVDIDNVEKNIDIITTFIENKLDDLKPTLRKFTVLDEEHKSEKAQKSQEFFTERNLSAINVMTTLFSNPEFRAFIAAFQQGEGGKILGEFIYSSAAFEKLVNKYLIINDLDIVMRKILHADGDMTKAKIMDFLTEYVTAGDFNNFEEILAAIDEWIPDELDDQQKILDKLRKNIEKNFDLFTKDHKDIKLKGVYTPETIDALFTFMAGIVDRGTNVDTIIKHLHLDKILRGQKLTITEIEGMLVNLPDEIIEVIDEKNIDALMNVLSGAIEQSILGQPLVQEQLEKVGINDLDKVVQFSNDLMPFLRSVLLNLGALKPIFETASLRNILSAILTDTNTPSLTDQLQILNMLLDYTKELDFASVLNNEELISGMITNLLTKNVMPTIKYVFVGIEPEKREKAIHEVLEQAAVVVKKVLSPKMLGVLQSEILPPLTALVEKIENEQDIQLLEVYNLIRITSDALLTQNQLSKDDISALMGVVNDNKDVFSTAVANLVQEQVLKDSEFIAELAEIGALQISDVTPIIKDLAAFSFNIVDKFVQSDTIPRFQNEILPMLEPMFSGEGINSKGSLKILKAGLHAIINDSAITVEDFKILSKVVNDNKSAIGAILDKFIAENIIFRKLNIDVEKLVEVMAKEKNTAALIGVLDAFANGKNLGAIWKLAGIEDFRKGAFKMLFSAIGVAIREYLMPDFIKRAIAQSSVVDIINNSAEHSNNLGQAFDEHTGRFGYFSVHVCALRSLSNLNIQNTDMSDKIVDQFEFRNAKLPNNLSGCTISQSNFAKVHFTISKEDREINLQKVTIDADSLYSMCKSLDKYIAKGVAINVEGMTISSSLESSTMDKIRETKFGSTYLEQIMEQTKEHKNDNLFTSKVEKSRENSMGHVR